MENVLLFYAVSQFIVTAHYDTIAVRFFASLYWALSGASPMMLIRKQERRTKIVENKPKESSLGIFSYSEWISAPTRIDVVSDNHLRDRRIDTSVDDLGHRYRQSTSLVRQSSPC